MSGPNLLRLHYVRAVLASLRPLGVTRLAGRPLSVGARLAHAPGDLLEAIAALPPSPVRPDGTATLVACSALQALCLTVPPLVWLRAHPRVVRALLEALADDWASGRQPPPSAGAQQALQGLLAPPFPLSPPQDTP